MMRNQKWPENVTVIMHSRWQIKPGKEGGIKPNTTAMMVAADSMDNQIKLFINPALGWEGTYQELQDEWISVPIETPLTF